MDPHGRRRHTPAPATGSRSRATPTSRRSCRRPSRTSRATRPRSPLVDEGTLYYWQVIPTCLERLRLHGSCRRLRRLHGLAELPARVGAADADLARRRRAARRAPSCSSGRPCRSRSGTTRSRSPQDDSFSTILESRDHRRHVLLGDHDLPGRRDGVLARARQQRRQQGPRLVGDVDASCRRCPYRRSRRPQPFPGATFPALTWTPVDGATSYEVQDVWPDASVHVTSSIPSTAVSYTKMTGTGHGTVQVRAVFANGFKSAYTPARDVVHTIGEPGGTKTQLINKPRQARADVRVEHEDERQAVQGAGLAESGLHAAVRRRQHRPVAATRRCSPQQDFIDGGSMYWRVAVIDPDGNIGAFSQGRRSSRCWHACRCRSPARRRTGTRRRGDRHRAERQGQADQGRRGEAPRARASSTKSKQDEQEGRRASSRSSPRAPAISRRPRPRSCSRSARRSSQRRVGRAGVPGRRPGTPRVPCTATMAAVSDPATQRRRRPRRAVTRSARPISSRRR